MRKRFLTASIPWFLLTGVLLVIAAYAPSYAVSPGRAVFRTETMGTWATLTLVTNDSASVADLAYDALTVLHRVDSLMSNWTDISEVARINRDAALQPVTVQSQVADVVGFAEQVTKQSDGAFDITIEPLVRLWGFIGGKPHVPTQDQITETLVLVGSDNLRFDPENDMLVFNREGVKIDLGGIAKGYGVDRVADVLRASGTTDALIDLSGNMVALGEAGPQRGGWVVGIRDPTGAQPYIARIRLHDNAVATSGDYEQFVAENGKRYGHILDPRTGWSAHGFSSVTVVSEQAMTADAWATALFVLGPARARQIAAERDDLSVILLEPGSGDTTTVWIEDDASLHFELESAARKNHVIRHF